MRAETEVEILNKYGFHARPSTSFTLLAQKFASNIKVSCPHGEADGKSIIALMSLGAQQGIKIKIRADGADAEAAVSALAAHVNSRFGGID